MRDQRGLTPSDWAEVALDGAADRYEAVPVACSVTALKGIIFNSATPVSIEEMNVAIAEQGASA
jgi:antitoxin PrlF